MSKQISILLADDHHIVRQGMELMIDDLIENPEFHHASSIGQILEKIENFNFDFAILDAQLPDGNCLDIIPKIKEIQPELKLLVFSSFDETTHSLKFINAGADGFLSKLSDESEIKTAIQELITNGHFHSTVTQTIMILSEGQPHLLNPFTLLSEREFEIAELFSKGYGNLEIANELEIKQNTVSTYKKRIFEKLKINKMIDLIELFHKHHH